MRYYSNFVLNFTVPICSLHTDWVIRLSNTYQATYYYHLKDLHGNLKAVVSPDTNNTAMVNQSNDYYPFGMALTMEFAAKAAGEAFTEIGKAIPTKDITDDSKTFTRSNAYLYNGKEEQPMPGKWLDYGARMYDPTLGRFHIIDRFSEKYYPLSPYQYANNNPVFNIDINGDWFSGAVEWLNKIHNHFQTQISVKQGQISRNVGKLDQAKNAGKEKKADRIQKRIQRQEGQLATLNSNYSVIKSEINEMANSNQEYHINSTFNRTGAVGFDWGSSALTINFNGKSENALANFAHELKHGFQFEEGKLSIIPNSYAGGDLYDIQDEVEAYQRMQMFGVHVGRTIDESWVKREGSQYGSYSNIIKQNKINQISTSTAAFGQTWKTIINTQINSAGRSSVIPPQVIIHWQKVY